MLFFGAMNLLIKQSFDFSDMFPCETKHVLSEHCGEVMYLRMLIYREKSCHSDFSLILFRTGQLSLVNCFIDLSNDLSFFPYHQSLGCFHLFQYSVAFHKETSCLICFANQVISFYMECNTWQK